MKLFSCHACHALLFFESVSCVRCGHTLAYLPDAGLMSAMNALPDGGVWEAQAPAVRGQRFRLCRNSTEFGVCNWAVPIDDPDPLCRACRLNAIIPNLSEPGAREAWARIEVAKHRLVYSLLSLGLPVETRSAPEGPGLAFEFMRDTEDEKVWTGHNDGVITINIAEADDPFREKTRVQLGEPYRTLLGHFRHEIGHYYWDRLVAGTPMLARFREVFGDESPSYADAMSVHYENGPRADWQARYVSAYASAHPWEDWAETWAHYLHMVDTLETARAFGLSLKPSPVAEAKPPPATAPGWADFRSFDDLWSGWVALTAALNSLNRSMGLPDSYPFVLSPVALDKLRFVHEVVQDSG